MHKRAQHIVDESTYLAAESVREAIDNIQQIESSTNTCALTELFSDIPLDDVERYTRQMIISEVGIEGQKKLLESKVLVVGCGGLGSPTLLYLVAAGIQNIGISDGDTVEESNLNRQIIYNEGSLQRKKTEEAKKQIVKINRKCKVEEFSFITKENIWEVCSSYDLILDCTDSRYTRYLLSDYCSIRRIPFICGSSLRWEGAVYSLQNMCYRCIYPIPSRKKMDTCASAGIIGSACGVVGSLIATEAIKTLIGNVPISYALHFNLLRNEWIHIPFKTKAPCTICEQREKLTVGEIKKIIGIEEDTFNAPQTIPCGKIKKNVPNYIAPEHTQIDISIDGAVDISIDSLADTVTVDNVVDNSAISDTVEVVFAKNSISWETIKKDAEHYFLVDIRSPIEQKILSVPTAFPYPVGKIIENPKDSFKRLHKKAAGRKIAIFCRNGIVSQKFSILMKGLTVTGGIQRFLTLQQKEKEKEKIE
ncbi:sulfur-carrier protein adenylyltransferase/sulfurtransferase [Nematocida sp. LUAm3]|nr:sulfur-carrier protein adenylyltransferase/sulfurtransferase [Nematocida sp. LUAm3]